jgi:hypothetical protein
MTEQHFFDELITRLRDCDKDAADRIFHEFTSRLIGLARQPVSPAQLRLRPSGTRPARQATHPTPRCWPASSPNRQGTGLQS